MSSLSEKGTDELEFLATCYPIDALVDDLFLYILSFPQGEWTCAFDIFHQQNGIDTKLYLLRDKTNAFVLILCFICLTQQWIKRFATPTIGASIP